MRTLIHTDNGLRPVNAPCRNAVDWLGNHMALTRCVTIVLGRESIKTDPHSILIIDRSGPRVSTDRKARQLFAFLTDLTRLWRVKVVIEAHGEAVETLLSIVPDLNRSGIAQINLYGALTGSVSTFLKLSDLGRNTPEIVNHLTPPPFCVLIKQRLIDSYGPADRPICQGYQFRHSFWQDVAH